jgi:hypothetical protein
MPRETFALRAHPVLTPTPLTAPSGPQRLTLSRPGLSLRAATLTLAKPTQAHVIAAYPSSSRGFL